MSRNLIRGLFLAFLFLLPLVVLLPHLSEIAYQPGAEYSDMAVTHLPNALFLQGEILRGNGVPLWSPLILGGYPFAANPLSGLFYPPGWAALLLPLPLGLNLMVILHLLWGGWGMFRLLRAEGLHPGGAIFGALAFEAMPKLIAHHGAGHLTLIYAVSWTPWLLMAGRRREGPAFLRVAIPGLVLGLIVLADPRWAAYAGLLLAAYRLHGWVVSVKEQPASQGAGVKDGLSGAGWLAGVVIFAALVAAPLILPLAQYTALSTRSLMTGGDRMILSLPPGNLLGLLYPAMGGSAEWAIYPGAVALALTLLALGSPQIRRRARLWLALIPLTLLYALGSNIPGLDRIAALPGFDLLRVPPRALFLSGFCFSAAAAHALDHLLDPDHEKIKDRSGLLLFAVTAFAVLLAVAVAFVVEDPRTRFQFGWGAFFLLAAAVTIFRARAGQIRTSAVWFLMLLLGIVNLAGVNAVAAEYRSTRSVLDQDREVAQYLADHGQGNPFRVYSPSYSLPQLVGAVYGIEQASGVDPLQLQSFAEFMSPAAGVPIDGYSVTQPPFATGDPKTDNRLAAPDSDLLALLNVRYVVAEYRLRAENFTLLAQIEDTYIYENRRVMPRAWVQDPSAPAGADIIEGVQVEKTPNNIRLRANGPGLLVLSEIAYPGWQVTVDGSPARMETPLGLLRGVVLPAGNHTVVFNFRPLPVYIGMGLSALALGALTAALIWQRRQYRTGRG